MSNLRLARVVAFHPSGRADIVCMDGDGARFGNVPVGLMSASTDTIFVDKPKPSEWPSEDASASTLDREVVAVVAFFVRCPVILCFLPPQLSECLFADDNLMLHRHASDFYWSVDGSGNLQWSHPSGAFVHFGEGEEYRDLTGKDQNKAWQANNNTDKQPNFIVKLGGKDAPVAQLKLKSDGSMELALNSDFKLSSQGSGTMSFDGGLTITADTKIDGNLHVTQDINADGQVADASGSMQEMRGYYNGHTHVDPQGGATAPPVPLMS